MDECMGETATIRENLNIIISSVIVRLRSESQIEYMR